MKNREKIEAKALQVFPPIIIKDGIDIEKGFRNTAIDLAEYAVSQQPVIKWVTGEYERLWDWANNPDRVRSIPMYVDYTYRGDYKQTFRDISHRQKVEHGFGARGIGYSTYSSYFPDEMEHAKELFFSDCKSLNVEWLDESSPSPSYSEELKTAELKTAVESAIATFEWLGMIGGKGLIEHERMREFVTKYKPLIDKIEGNAE